MRLLVTAAVCAAFAAAAPAALADNVGISLSTSSPEQGIPVTVTVSGSSSAIDSEGDGAFLYAVARPSGGVGCQSSFGADQVAAGNASTVLIDGDEQDPGQGFSEQTDFTPDVGGSLICAWLETDGDDGDDVATPNEVTAGPVASTFTAASPQVGPLKVSVPATIKVNQAYDITYATQTDQDLSLDSIVIPAGGSGCAGSYELEVSDLDNPDDIFGGSTDIYGAATTTGIDKEATAGSYTICSWIEGPDDSQVDATSATPIKVVAAAASPGGSTSSGTGSTPSSGTTTRTGTSTTPSAAAAACVVPRTAGLTLAQAKTRLKAAGCRAGAVHDEKTTRVKPGRVLKLSAPAGRQLKHDAAVGITVATH
jgi:hypothetical protein